MDWDPPIAGFVVRVHIVQPLEAQTRIAFNVLQDHIPPVLVSALAIPHAPYVGKVHIQQERVSSLSKIALYVCQELSVQESEFKT